ncbi:MAG: TetR/AcrR family transcriptional regulator [Propionibacteriales bacterium]|nr:TetR/AcrR family transcriptional regulator [Propionibacteriales bacterium]
MTQHSRTRPTRLQVQERILAAALEVFADNGFDRASIDDIARAADFTKGAVYSNFASKDELFLALMDDQVHRRVQAAEQAALEPGSGSAAEVIAAVMSSMTADQPHWHRLFLEYWARALRQPVLHERFLQHRRQLRTAITDALSRLHPDNGRRHDGDGLSDDDLGTTILALSNGFAIETLADPDQVDPTSLGRVLARLMR